MADDHGRIRSLDGLRGAAAVVVLLYHSIILSPVAAALYLAPQNDGPSIGSPFWIIARSPLQLFFSGQEAVLVFFVLSGFALTIPVLRATSFDWLAYYPRRLVRLMLPVAASVIIAAIIILCTPQDPSLATSQWAGPFLPVDLNPGAVIQGIDLLGGDGSINNPLWSLRYEVLFSLLLPVYLLLARPGRRHWFLVVAGAVIVMVLGEFASDVTLVFLPSFLFGVLIAMRYSNTQGRQNSPASEPTNSLRWAAILVVSLLALESMWVLDAVGLDGSLPKSFAHIAATLGAAGLVLVVTRWRPTARVFEARPMLWLGKISFSLYLVHVPIILGTLAVVKTLNPSAPWYAVSAVAIPIAFAIAYLFSRFVEAPSHRLSRRVGQWTSAHPIGAARVDVD